MKKTRILWIVAALCALLLIVVFSLNVSIAGEPWMAGGCISVSFDKWDMLRADKMIVHFRGEQFVITDKEFVQNFTAGTLAGTYSDYCCANLDDGWVEIYRGDRLIRRMRYIENHDAFAYEADFAHWVLFGDEAHVFFSGEICSQLRQLIGLG